MEVFDQREHRDERGSILKIYGAAEAAAPHFFQVKEVFTTVNRRNTLRGLAIQQPTPQAKIVKLLAGGAAFNAVQLDRSAADFGAVKSWISSGYDNESYYLPKGWALGYRALRDETIVLYLADEEYSSETVGVTPLSPEFIWGTPEDLFDPTRIFSKDLHRPLLQDFLAQ